MAEDGLLHTAELLKTALPYVDVRSKFFLDLLVKIYELIACLRNFRTKDMAACGFENTSEKVDAETLLKKIRPSCTPKERAFVDKILSIFQAKRIYEMYNAYMEAMNESGNFDGFPGNDNGEGNTDNLMNSFSDIDLSEIVGNDDSYINYPATSYADTAPADCGDNINAEESQNNSPPVTDNDELIESLKAMLPPEQMETFENLRMLFDSMSYDDNKKSESDRE